jgi:hypothetical protein
MDSSRDSNGIDVPESPWVSSVIVDDPDVVGLFSGDRLQTQCGFDGDLL